MSNPVTMFVVILTLHTCHPSLAIKSGRFVKDSICDVQKRIDDNCSRVESKYKHNILRCLSACVYHTGCKGASLENNTGRCYLHNTCSSVSHDACNTPDTAHINYYATYCFNGDWNQTTQVCACTPGTSGERCNINDPVTLTTEDPITLTSIDPVTTTDDDNPDPLTSTPSDPPLTSTEEPPDVNEDPSTTDLPPPSPLPSPSPCVHGQMNPVTNQCDCPIWASGDYCEDVFDSCDRLYDFVHTFGDFDIYIDPAQDGSLYRIRCSIVLGGYFAILVTANAGGHDEYNRTWNEYVSGFEHGEAYWIGLQAWHAINAHLGCNRMTVIVPIDMWQSGAAYRTYNNFIVGDAASNYAFSFTSSDPGIVGEEPLSFEVGDCMSSFQHLDFSTWDRDNDMTAGQNCASRFGFGWWHAGNCDNPCNLLSRGFKSPDWENEPVDKRFKMLGVDMNVEASSIFQVRIYLDACLPR